MSGAIFVMTPARKATALASARNRLKEYVCHNLPLHLTRSEAIALLIESAPSKTAPVDPYTTIAIGIAGPGVVNHISVDPYGFRHSHQYRKD